MAHPPLLGLITAQPGRPAAHRKAAAQPQPADPSFHLFYHNAGKMKTIANQRKLAKGAGYAENISKTAGKQDLPFLTIFDYDKQNR